MVGRGHARRACSPSHIMGLPASQAKLSGHVEFRAEAVPVLVRLSRSPTPASKLTSEAGVALLAHLTVQQAGEARDKKKGGGSVWRGEIWHINTHVCYLGRDVAFDFASMICDTSSFTHCLRLYTHQQTILGLSAALRSLLLLETYAVLHRSADYYCTETELALPLPSPC